MSVTDPDADAPQERPKQAWIPDAQRRRWGHKARIVLDALVTPAEATENLPMLELLFRSRFRRRLRPRFVTGDAA